MSGGVRGAALLEILVASGAALLVVAMVGGLYPTHARAFAAGRDRQEVRATVRRVVDGIVREARALGFDPIAAPGDPDGFDGIAEGLFVAEANRIELRADRHGASPALPPNDRLDESSAERITFYRSASTGAVNQRTGDFAMPLNDRVIVPPNGLRFRYFDECEAELFPPLDPVARPRVVSLEVELSARPPQSTDLVTVAARTMLRNRRPGGCGSVP